MVITVTLNPAMDKTLTIDNFKAGAVNRVSNLRYDIGGKGINVSKVLKNFDIDSICIGFLGGAWERAILGELSDRGIKSEFIHIEGNTRTNTKVVDGVNKVFTDINEPGPAINKPDMECFLDRFNHICNSGDIVVLSGGVSTTVSLDIYAVLIKLAKEKGAIVILDADGELLREAIQQKPNIIKPNEHEISKLLGINSNNRSALIKGAYSLKKKGIENILISLGSKGALYLTDEGVYLAEAVNVAVKGTVGAGDSMVAGLIYSMINKFNSFDTLKFASACGTSAVSLHGTEACTLEQVKALVDKVNITKMGVV